MAKNAAAVALGRRGGKVSSDAKTAAARENGKKGGRPRKPQPESAETPAAVRPK
jgi:hypothetical protein